VGESVAIQRLGGRQSKLTEELIAKARDLAASGAPDKTLAAACGVSISAWESWLRNARSGKGSDLEIRFLGAIREGRAEGELIHVQRLHKGDSKDSQWLLTHSPYWRDTWSDASAIRRANQRQMEIVVSAIEASQSLTAEQKQEVLLQLQARGLGGVLPQQETNADG
jgi:hypothetical protein